MEDRENNKNGSDRVPLIYQNSMLFRSKFPSLPSLPIFLSLLSTDKPQAYSNIIPSREHKPVYLNALAWLIQYGYVTQLLTFINIRVDKHIKMAVDEDLEKEGFRKTNTARRPSMDYKKLIKSWMMKMGKVEMQTPAKRVQERMKACSPTTTTKMWTKKITKMIVVLMIVMTMK